MEPALKALKRPFSECVFASLFLFRNVHDYAVSECAHSYVTGHAYDGRLCLTALFPLHDLDALAWRRLLAGRALFPVTEEELALFSADEFDVAWNDDDSDYLYDAAALAELSGRAARTRRAQALAFEASWRPQIADLSNANLADAIQVLERWRGDVAKPWAQTDYDACLEGLQRHRELGLSGQITYAGAAPAGFVLASRLGDGSVAIHFAKGERAYAGIFAYMFREFARGMRGACSIVNFEQDLGNPGFRQAKRAFAPVRLLRKYRVSARER